MANPTYKNFVSSLKPITLSPDTSEDDRNCEICYCPFAYPIRLKCGHTFCKTCLLQSLIQRNLCPKCRHILFKKRRYDHTKEDGKYDLFTPEEEQEQAERQQRDAILDGEENTGPILDLQILTERHRAQRFEADLDQIIAGGPPPSTNGSPGQDV